MEKCVAELKVVETDEGIRIDAKGEFAGKLKNLIDSIGGSSCCCCCCHCSHAPEHECCEKDSGCETH